VPEVANFGKADLVVQRQSGEHVPPLGPESPENREPGGFSLLLIIGIDLVAGFDIDVAAGQCQGEAPREGVPW
jgi:hypothetical protein